MGLHYENLDSNVRQLMLKELQYDQGRNSLYLSSRLTPAGKSGWPSLLRESIEKHNDDWLANEIRNRNLLNSSETRNTTKGTITAKVPSNAPEMLAEGEFNRFYIRGVCSSAISTNQNVVAYRGKSVSNPRPDSEDKIGEKYSPQTLLEDLRNSNGIDTALGLPAGPNSGLTIKIEN